MKTMTVLIGVQASGKTTWRNKEKPNIPAICSDDWFNIDEVTGQRYWTDSEGKIHGYSEGLSRTVLSMAWAWFWKRYAELLQEGISFVVEGTFPTKISRSHLIHVAKAFGYKTEVVWFNTPLTECLERNKKRIDYIPDTVLARTFANMESPDWDEGWDAVSMFPRYT